MTNYLTAKGVQHFSITIAAGQTSGTATINAVGSLAFPIFGGFTVSTTGMTPDTALPRVELTNSTTVTAYRGASDANTVTVTGCVVDATSALVTSVQNGTITYLSTDASKTATVTAVTDANTALHCLGYTTNGSAATTNRSVGLTQSGTTVTATPGSAPGGSISSTVGFTLIEFASGALAQAVQRVQSVMSTNSQDTTITSVNMNRAIMFYAGRRLNSSTTWDNFIAKGRIKTATSVNFESTSRTVNIINNCSIVEFASGVLNSNVQRATPTTSGGSVASTITSVVKNNSALMFLGNLCTTASSDVAYAADEAVLTNSTTVTSTISSGSSDNTDSFEVAEFVPYVAPVNATLSSTGF